jgi:hypothetical protein
MNENNMLVFAKYLVLEKHKKLLRIDFSTNPQLLYGDF